MSDIVVKVLAAEKVQVKVTEEVAKTIVVQQGLPGDAGSQIYVTVGVPGVGVGITGDFAINSSNNDYYLKVAGVWVLQGQFVPSNVPAGGTTGQVLAKTSNADFDTEWVTQNLTGTANKIAYFDSSGDLASSAYLEVDTTSGGLLSNTNIAPDDLGGGFNVNYFGATFRPLQASPDEFWNIASVSGNIDPDSSGFDFGTSGNAINALSLNLSHGGTSDIGGVAMLNQYFNLGNGTDPIDVNGIAYAYGFANINANVNISGSIQGYGFQPAFNAASTIDPSGVGINAFYDFATFPISVPGYNSFVASPTILEVLNGHNYVTLQANPQITTLQGNAGCFGFGWSPQVGTVNASGSIQGIQMNPTVTLNRGYAAGININMSNVTNYAGVAASLVIQDITYTFLQAGAGNNAYSIEYLDTVSAGSETATIFGNLVTINIESGVSTATQVVAAINAVPALISALTPVITGVASDPQVAAAAASFTGGVDPGRKYAIDVVGDVNIVGGLAFTGSLSLAALNSFAPYTVASGLGVASVDTLITAPSVAANATITGTDLLAINTAMLLTIGDNASVTSSFLGYAALGLPAVLSMGTGSTIDLVEGAVFAVSLDASATGGTAADLSLCRALAIPNGVTTVTKLKGYRFDLPFGDPGTTTWGFHNDVATAHNYFKRNVVVGDSETPTNDSVGIEINSPTKGLLMSRLTSAEEAALSAVNGLMIYNVTLEKFRGYENGAWVDLV